jgi:hypothetical protein
LAFAGTPGMFRGIVGEVADRGPNWIYVEGRNGAIRVVEISSAKVVYDPKVPPSQRRKIAANSVARGADVRVTGELEDGGEWRASEIEIVHPGNGAPLKH